MTDANWTKSEDGKTMTHESGAVIRYRAFADRWHVVLGTENGVENTVRGANGRTSYFKTADAAIKAAGKAGVQ
jgi:hypothetical protein